MDRRTGALRWRAGTGVSGWVTWGRNAVLGPGVVVVGDVDLYAFDRTTGARRWTYQAPDLDETGRSWLAADSTTIYAGSQRGRVYAIDASNGTARWITPIPSDTTIGTFRPALRNGKVFVGYTRFTNPATGGLAALDAATGRILWMHDFLPEVSQQDAGCVDGADVYGNTVVTAAEDGRVYALDQDSGTVRWIAPRVHQLPPIPGAAWDDDRPLVVAGNIIVVGSTRGTMVGLDAQTGSELWRNTVDNGSITGDIATDGALAFAGHSGDGLWAYDVATGTVRWVAARGTQEHPTEILNVATVDSELPYVYTAGAEAFYAISRK